MTLCFVLNEPGVRGRDDGLENCFWSDTWAPGDASALSFSLSSVQFSTLTVTTGCSSVEPSAEKVGSPTKFVALGKKISAAEANQLCLEDRLWSYRETKGHCQV